MRVEIATIRRTEIVEAAVAVIMEQGLQNLSLSEIEKKAGMSRGQLTYYFPTKEDILLAVFDRTVQLMHQRIGSPDGSACTHAGGWEWVQYLMTALLTKPPTNPEFGCLQYTFLSQMGHREDFRQRLATLYEAWRSNMALGLASDMACREAARPVSPRALSTFVQAILHGLAMQRAVDPNAFDGGEMLSLCLDLLGNYLWSSPAAPKRGRRRTNKSATPARPRRRLRTAANGSPKG
jgi:AcrR family transcriptional regulator